MKEKNIEIAKKVLDIEKKIKKENLTKEERENAEIALFALAEGLSLKDIIEIDSYIIKNIDF